MWEKKWRWELCREVRSRRIRYRSSLCSLFDSGLSSTISEKEILLKDELPWISCGNFPTLSFVKWCRSVMNIVTFMASLLLLFSNFLQKIMSHISGDCIFLYFMSSFNQVYLFQEFGWVQTTWSEVLKLGFYCTALTCFVRTLFSCNYFSKFCELVWLKFNVGNDLFLTTLFEKLDLIRWFDCWLLLFIWFTLKKGNDCDTPLC